eukprot:CAMPEP_0194304168 /NCGR_PEP_ID=MMETSP0171-20130528/1959_1 /TAXON_ID=218684 /ORGANISM="Corethron pennatum, Strain L29A3" /LENGTH=482 /DNA_ID=CAMNT_0039055347 /DNA_START=506 /DNA_END=1954 /DNA_ORIENTATION=-
MKVASIFSFAFVLNATIAELFLEHEGCVDDDHQKISIGIGEHMPLCEWVAISPKERCESDCACEDHVLMKGICRKTCGECTSTSAAFGALNEAADSTDAPTSAYLPKGAGTYAPTSTYVPKSSTSNTGTKTYVPSLTFVHISNNSTRGTITYAPTSTYVPKSNKSEKGTKTYAPTSTYVPKSNKTKQIVSLEERPPEAGPVSGRFFLAVEKAPGTSNEVARESVKKTTLNQLKIFRGLPGSPPGTNATVGMDRIDVPCPDSAGTDCIVLETNVTLDFEGRPARSRRLDATTISSVSEEDRQAVLGNAIQVVRSAAEKGVYEDSDVIQSVSYFEIFDPPSGERSGRMKVAGVGAKTTDSAADSVQPFGTAPIVFLCAVVLLAIVLTVLAVRNRRMDEEDRELEDRDFLDDDESWDVKGDDWSVHGDSPVSTVLNSTAKLDSWADFDKFEGIEVVRNPYEGIEVVRKPFKPPSSPLSEKYTVHL